MNKWVVAAVVTALVGMLLVAVPARVQAAGPENEEEQLSPEEQAKASQRELIQDKREKIMEMREQAEGPENEEENQELGPDEQAAEDPENEEEQLSPEVGGKGGGDE